MSPAPEDVPSPPCGVESSAERIDLAATAFHTERPVSKVEYREGGYAQQLPRRNARIAGRPVVFLGRDEIGRRFEHDECEVVRGLGTAPPAHADYPRKNGHGFSGAPT
jgi:hypothetical protein